MLFPRTCPIADKGFPGISSLVPWEKEVPSSWDTVWLFRFVLSVRKITLFVPDQLVLIAQKLGVITLKSYLASNTAIADR